MKTAVKCREYGNRRKALTILKPQKDTCRRKEFMIGKTFEKDMESSLERREQNMYYNIRYNRNVIRKYGGRCGGLGSGCRKGTKIFC